MSRIIELRSGGHLERAVLFDDEGSRRIFDRLRDEIVWEAREIVLFGKRLLQPRLISWCGDLPYRYSGQTLEPRPFPPLVQALTERVRRHTSVPFDHVLLNRYRSGTDSMGYHADDEPELGEAPTVASLSFGAARPFVLKSRHDRAERPCRLELGSGELLVMHPPCQARYRHALPKVKGMAEERVSLTFRQIVAPAHGSG